MVVDIREICGQDKSQTQLWQGYTSLWQPTDRTMSRNIPAAVYWTTARRFWGVWRWLTIAWWDSQYAFSMKGPG